VTRRYLTVSIPYVNAAPHLGYALELVQADALARRWRQQGDEVRFLGGTDDHALKNALAAEEAGVPTADYVNANAARFESLASPLAVVFDDFIRTSVDRRHRPGVEELWRRTESRGDFYRKHYEGLYCVGCEQFYAESDLVDGRACPEHGTPVEVVAEENWFFRLSRYEPEILDVLESGRLRIEPEGYLREAIAVVRGGLEDISVSRSAVRHRHWGIPVPGDPSQVIYVWWEALANYITALGFGGGDVGSSPSPFDEWWCESDERVHVIGKGILRFHAIYWPALLLSAGLPLPTHLFVHPYLTANGKKLSKSTGNIVDPSDVVLRYGTDRTRWWLLADVPRAADADYTDARLVERTDDDLANGVSNAVHRVLTMVNRFCHLKQRPRGGFSGDRTPSEHGEPVYDFRADTAGVLRAVADINATVEGSRPWQLAKLAGAGDEGAGQRLGDVLGELVTKLWRLAALLEPLVPDTAARLRALLTPDDGGRLPPPAPLHTRFAGLAQPAE
jgi:methionyl-tRNA synthetase